MLFQVARGTNISHWLSQSRQRGAERRAYFTQEDVKRIAAMGHGAFDHIRLPIDEEQMWDRSGYRYDEAFDLLDAALDWCAEAGLKVIVDLHLLRAHHFLDEGNPPLYTSPREEERFVALWRDLSHRLDDRPTNSVAYELLNEAVARDPEDWNRVAMSAYHAIREQEPGRTIVLGSNWFNQHHTFRDLYVPEDDDLILTFHYYTPMFITHYGASWWADGGTYDGPIHYPGSPIADEDLAVLDSVMRAKIESEDLNRAFGPQAMLEDLALPLRIARERGLPLYCGEFGCYDHTPDPLRRAWYRDILSVFDQHDIAWANWDYKGSFGVVDADGSPTAVAEVLLGA